MGLMDIFSSDDAQKAADQKKAGLFEGYNLAHDTLQSGLNNATDYYKQAFGPLSGLSGTANNAYSAYADALGLNGDEGKTRAMSNFQSFNPGYQYQVDQAITNADRGAAARGTLNSGGQRANEIGIASNLANQNYSNYLSSLGGLANNAVPLAGMQSNIYTGLGGLQAQYALPQAAYGYQYGTGVGDANAAATMANYNASANGIGAIMNGVKLGTQVLGFLSDERTKENIEPVGELNDGQTVYRYNYKGEGRGRTQLGLIAQEVEKRTPEAVGQAGPFKTVDYKRATDKAVKRSKMSAFSGKAA